MPGSDDQYDLVHTFNQAQAGKSKTSRPAVREVGREGAAVELFIGEEIDQSTLRTPPAGVHFVFVNQSGTLAIKDSTGTVETLTGNAPDDAEYVTVSSSGELSDERTLAVSDGLSLTDNGAGNDVTVDAAALQDPSYVTVNGEAGLDSERTLATGTGLGLTDAGANGDITVDADTLRGEDYVTTSSAPSLANETVAGSLNDVYGSPVSAGASIDLGSDDITNVGSINTEELATVQASMPLSRGSNISGSRSKDTTYQNTTGSTIIVAIELEITDSSGNDTVNALLLAGGSSSLGTSNTVDRWTDRQGASAQVVIRLFAEVGDQQYYELLSGSDDESNINTWKEFERDQT